MTDAPETNPAKGQNMVPGAGLATLICIYQPKLTGIDWSSNEEMLLALAGWTGLFSTILAGIKRLRNGGKPRPPDAP